MHIWFADFEVFKHDWLFMARSQDDGTTVAFWNDNAGVAQFLAHSQPVLCGYNFRDYDSHILKAILLDWSPEEVHHVSETIIFNDDRSRVWALFQGEPWIDLPPIIDLFHDIVPRKGLKEIEANIGMDIVESSVPFDIARPLTPAEREESERYCFHDIEATEALYELRFDYLKAKTDLCKMSGVDPLTMLKHTNARIVSEVLEAERMPSPPYEKYEIPANVDRTAIPESVVTYVEQINTDNCADESVKLEFMFHGCPTTFGLGGIHAAIPAYKETASEDRVILIQDISSYYPSLIINNGYMSRAVPDTSLYKRFYDMRMEAKAKGDKATAEAAKLVLNTTFGAMKDTYNKMYDPMMATRVCVSGELYILDLIEQLHRAVGDALTVIQLNTDGWVISLPRTALSDVERAVGAWQARTGFTVDTDEVEVIVQANVNNYVMRFVEGGIKAKGGVVARHAGGDFKSNSATIIDKAVVDYLLDGTPIKQTVEECDQLERFQIVAKMGSTFQSMVHVVDGCEVEAQRVNRVYATTDERYGGIFKRKLEHGEEVARSKVPLTPERCLIDNENRGLTTLDKSWYVALAKKKAREFTTRNKKEREQMADVDESTNELQQTEEKPKPTRKRAAKAEEPVVPSFHERLLELQAAMQGVSTKVVFDSVVNNIGYEYADTQQYKKMLAQACNQLGLIIKLDICCSFLGVISPPDKTPTYGSEATGVVTITDANDPENYETYTISGFGSNVQPGYCNGAAQTNALRNFILNNWFLDNKGREGDDQAFNAAPDSAKYVSPADKAQLRQGIADSKAEESKYATTLFAKALYDRILEAQAFKPDFGAKMIAKHFEADGTPKESTPGKSTMTKQVAVAGMNEAESIIATGGE